jgi:hypothetical protein
MVVPAACAVFALTACSASQAAAPENGEPAVGTVPVLLDSVNLRLPVQDYLRTDDDAARLGQARLTLARQCLQRFGLDYPAEQPSSAGYGPRSLTERRYGITDAALARTNGYGLGARDPSLQPQPAKPDLGPDGETALTGQGPSAVRGVPVPDGGCLGEADRRLTAGEPAGADLDLGQKLQFQSFDATKRDSRVRAVNQAWSACMARQNYHYTDPLAAMADPAFLRGAPTPEQITVAETDIRCKAETNVIGVWFTVESAYQRRAIDHDSAAFATARAALATQRDVVAEVERSAR